MGEKRQINGRNIIDDLRSGMTDRELQVKHRLSTSGLCTIYEKLVDRGAISHSELSEWSQFVQPQNALQGITKLS